MIDGDAVTRVFDILEPEDFYWENNREIYRACLELFSESTGIDQQTVRNRLIVNDMLEGVGGDAYLAAAIADTAHAVHVRDYAEEVRSMSTLRRLADAGNRVADVGSDQANAKDVDSAVKQAEEIVLDVGHRYGIKDFAPIRESRVIQDFFDPPEVKSDRTISTGFDALDAVLGGFHRTDMIVLAARPGFGKSTLALNFALSAAKESRVVGIFSLEMGSDQVAHRLAAAHTGINIQKIRNDALTPVERDRLSDAYGLLSDLPIYIDEATAQTAGVMSAKARRLKMQNKGNLDFLIVDYMQLISGSSNGREGNRVQEVSEISRLLKAIARDLDIPVIAVSQLNRAVEQRQSHEPRLADLRESGSIEQDADVVMFIHRVDKNISEEEWNRRNPTQEYPEGQADVIIAKHRHGPTDTVKLSVQDDIGRFYSIPEVSGY